jgi:hypothetical protein
MADAKPSRLLLRITLRDIEPPIWRRVVVADHMVLAQLHDVIQTAFGWKDCHMHEFHAGRERFGRPDFDGDFPSDGPPLRDERKTTLAEALGARREFSYWYDFGDDWWHDIVVEGRETARANAARATLLAGENACPPDDCGGPYGYAELLAALRDPTHPEHAEMREWAGDFDAQRFDLAKAARAVARTTATKLKRFPG